MVRVTQRSDTFDSCLRNDRSFQCLVSQGVFAWSLFLLVEFFQQTAPNTTTSLSLSLRRPSKVHDHEVEQQERKLDFFVLAVCFACLDQLNTQCCVFPTRVRRHVGRRRRQLPTRPGNLDYSQSLHIWTLA